MRNPSGGAPTLQGELADARAVSIDEKPVRRCAVFSAVTGESVISCPSMRNPSGGAPGRLLEVQHRGVRVHR